MKLVLTCEHGGNEIPAEYKHLFKDAGYVLNSHRGFDPGALDLFYHLSDLADYSYSQTTSRLLVELNRSPGHPQLFSEFTKSLSLEEKEELLRSYYHPYRIKVEKEISTYILKGEEVLHFSIHSFTPQLNGKIRMADVGLLYDPAKIREKQVVRDLKDLMVLDDPALRIRFNYPYLGKADGFTTYLRKKFPSDYMGIEIEVNQKFEEKDLFPPGIKNSHFEAIKKLKSLNP